jgi:Zn-dependent peptidase ImmA (M78 family)/transcriptional regulator with XRE-family HTH domain
MSLDLVALGQKIQRYRAQLQLAPKDLSAATGIEVPLLERIEKGLEKPSGDQILILADFFRCDYKFLISNEKLAPFEQTENLYRRYGDEFSAQDRRAVQDFLYLCENEYYLQGTLGRLPLVTLSVRLSGNIYKRHGAQAASQVRSLLGYQPHDATKAELYQDLRSLGIHVFRRALGNSNISGICIHHPVAGPCLLVNYSEDVYRQRFSAAHEAAHALIDKDEEVVVSFFRGRTHKDWREIRANSFASAYLLPPSFLKKIPNSRQWDEGKIREWCRGLFVNAETLSIALREAGLISDGQQRRFRTIRLPRDSKIDPELPDDLPPLSRQRKQALLRAGLSSRYVNLCFEAYHGAVISAARLAEMLLAEERDVLTIADLFGERLNDAD